MTFDGKAFGKDIVETTKAYIDKTVGPLLKQIDALKAEIDVLKSRPAPKDGKDADQDAVAAAVASIITGNMRKDFEELRASVAAIPALPDVPAIVAKAVEAAMPAPVDVKALVVEAVAALPPAKDGAPGPKGEPGAIGPAGKDGADGINGKNGVDLAGAMIDRHGDLVLTLSNGTTCELGHVVGKDVDMVTVEGMVDKATHKAIAEAWAAIPEPKDGERGPQGEPGKSVTVEDIAPLVENTTRSVIGEIVDRLTPGIIKSVVEQIPVPQAPQLPDIDAMVTKAVMALPPAQDGKDADPALVASQVAEQVQRAVAALPAAKDGQSVTVDEVRPLIEAEVTKAVTLITVKDGADGKDGVRLEELVPVIEDRVQKAAAAIPVPKDGKDGRDAVDVKDLLVVENGELVATFADGRVKTLGPFRGKDGAPGADGKDGRDIDPQTVEKLIDEKIAKVAPPEIERDAYLADITKMIEEAVAKHEPVEEEEFAPDDVAANISLAVKMMAERPTLQMTVPEQKTAAAPTINIALSDNREPTVVNVAPPSINIEARRSKEVTKVTGYDENGRIKTFEKTEVDE